MREVLAWARDFTDDTPYEILRTHPGAAPGWLADLRKFCRGGAPETVSSTAMSLGLILKAMADDRVVDLVCPEAGEGLDVDAFVRGGTDTLFLVSEGGDGISTAPLVTAFASAVVSCAPPQPDPAGRETRPGVDAGLGRGGERRTADRLNVQLRVWAKCTGGGNAASRPAPPVTDDASFASFLTESGPRTGASRHKEPGGGLDRADVQAVLSSGDAVWLLPDDPLSPFRYSGRWYGVTDGMPGELWQPVDDERGAQLDLMLSRLTLVGRPGSGSP
jgi:hypothetical protein